MFALLVNFDRGIDKVVNRVVDYKKYESRRYQATPKDEGVVATAIR